MTDQRVVKVVILEGTGKIVRLAHSHCSKSGNKSPGTLLPANDLDQKRSRISTLGIRT